MVYLYHLAVALKALKRMWTTTVRHGNIFFYLRMLEYQARKKVCCLKKEAILNRFCFKQGLKLLVSTSLIFSVTDKTNWFIHDFVCEIFRLFLYLRRFGLSVECSRVLQGINATEYFLKSSKVLKGVSSGMYNVRT